MQGDSGELYANQRGTWGMSVKNERLWWALKNIGRVKADIRVLFPALSPPFYGAPNRDFVNGDAKTGHRAAQKQATFMHARETAGRA